MAEPQDATVRGESRPGLRGRKGRERRGAGEEVKGSGGWCRQVLLKSEFLICTLGEREGNSAFVEVINVNNRLLGAGIGEE